MSKRVVLVNLSPCVAIFGSARLKQDHPHCVAAEQLSKRLSDSFISVATGGGPGVMEAANKGAYQGNATSVGFKIYLPFESDRDVEQYHHITVRQELFQYRQTALIENASGYAAFMGGIGTEFEVYNVMTLMQCGFLPRSEIQLYGYDAWDMFDKRMKKFVEDGMISEDDLKLYNITEDVDQMFKNLKVISRRDKINTIDN